MKEFITYYFIAAIILFTLASISVTASLEKYERENHISKIVFPEKTFVETLSILIKGIIAFLIPVTRYITVYILMFNEEYVTELIAKTISKAMVVVYNNKPPVNEVI